MSSSTITRNFGHSIRKPEIASTQSVEIPAAVEAAEERRWLLMLGLPFIAAAAFFAATIATGLLWLMAPALVLGPGLMILSFVYLSISSNSNGE